MRRTDAAVFPIEKEVSDIGGRVRDRGKHRVQPIARAEGNAQKIKKPAKSALLLSRKFFLKKI
jgi:hypothetical protein